MESEEASNSQLKQRITELRLLLEKKKRKLQTSLRHSELPVDDSPHVKRVRFSEPVPVSPLCSQNLFDDDSDAAVAAALGETNAPFDCDLDAFPAPDAAPSLRLHAPCGFQPTACDFLLRRGDVFLCLWSARRVQVFCGPVGSSAPLRPLWGRTSSRASLMLARLLPLEESSLQPEVSSLQPEESNHQHEVSSLQREVSNPQTEVSNLRPDGPILLLAEAKDDNVHIICLEFHDHRLHSAYSLCAFPLVQNLLSFHRNGPPIFLLASSPQVTHAALVTLKDRELCAVKRWECRFAITSAVAVTSSHAVVLARIRDKSQFGVVRLENGSAEMFPSVAVRPFSVELLREEGSYHFLGGLESEGAQTAAFLLCFCASTLRIRRVRTIPLASALIPEGPSTFWSGNVLLWCEGRQLQASILDWATGTGQRKAGAPKQKTCVLLLSMATRRALCLCGTEMMTLCFSPAAT